MQRGKGWWLAAALWLLLITAFAPQPAGATPQPVAGPVPVSTKARQEGTVVSPQRHVKAPLGAYLTGLGDFDNQKKTFNASFWLWTLTQAGESNILSSMEFPNAVKVESPSEISTPTPQGIWWTRKIAGTFRHDWDMRRFPFDRQSLHIDLEEADNDTSVVRYAADAANSSIDGQLKIPGWRVRGFRIESGDRTYRSNFGDPRLPPGSPSTYTATRLTVDLERSDRSVFWKLTAGALAAAVMAMVSYGLHVDNGSCLSPRFGLLAGSVFAAVISMRSAASELGALAYTTLIDQVHLLVLLYILVAVATGVLTWTHYRRHNDVKAIHRACYRVGVVSTLALLGALGVLFAGAIGVQ
jgi:hypothetical protein